MSDESGSLPSVTAMHAGFRVTATDYYEDALQVTRANAGRNLGREPAVRMVNWRSWPDDLGMFDVIVAADVVYEKEYAVLVAACIARALAPDGEAIVADPGRASLEQFRAHLPVVGLELIETTTTPYHEGKINQQIQVMRVRHRRG